MIVISLITFVTLYCWWATRPRVLILHGTSARRLYRVKGCLENPITVEGEIVGYVKFENKEKATDNPVLHCADCEESIEWPDGGSPKIHICIGNEKPKDIQWYQCLTKAEWDKAYGKDT